MLGDDPAQGQELDSMILMGPFELNIFYDNNDKVLCCRCELACVTVMEKIIA